MALRSMVMNLLLEHNPFLNSESREAGEESLPFSTFVVRGLLSLAPSRLFLMLRFGYCSSIAVFRFPHSALCFLCSSAFQRSWVYVLAAAPSRCAKIEFALYSRASCRRPALEK